MTGCAQIQMYSIFCITCQPKAEHFELEKLELANLCLFCEEKLKVLLVYQLADCYNFNKLKLLLFLSDILQQCAL